MNNKPDLKVGDRVICMFAHVSRNIGKRTSIESFYGTIAGNVYGATNHVIKDMVKVKSDDGRMWSCMKKSIYKPT